MATGFVTTARGAQLNMDELIDASKRPLYTRPEASEIAPKAPRKQALNVRGHKPVMNEVVAAPPSSPGEPSPKSVASSFANTGKATSVADLTGVKIDKPKFTKGKTKDEIDPNSTLNSILTDLAVTTKDSSGIKENNETL